MSHHHYQWAVIGAGPAGIAAVGNLLDAGIEAKSIAWIDPQFAVGDFGAIWNQVSSNTSVQLFYDFFKACRSFAFEKAPSFFIERLNPEETCLLQYAVEPLQWITQHLLESVVGYQEIVSKVLMADNHWMIKMESDQTLLSKNMILATGSETHSLSIGQVKEIPLQIALDKNKLKNAIDNYNKVAVFGSSHSAIILIRDLLELGVKEVVNFYLDPLRYAVFFDDWTLFDNTGLKGKTAEWARQNLHGNLPVRLQRYLSTPENIKKYFEDADAVIYATGFKRRQLEIVGLKKDFDYNPHCGIIAPGLFGVGIAFPEKTIDRYGHQELSVGLWKFMNYIKRVMPVWMAYA